MPTRYVRRAGLVLGGFVLGLLFVLAIAIGYFRVAADAEFAERVLGDVELPEDVLSLDTIEGDTIARVSVRELAFEDEAGNVIARAPLAQLTVDLESFAGQGPIELREVLLSEPSVNFVQYADGTTNFSDVVRVTAGGEEVQGGGGRPVVIRNLRIAGGDVVWSSPFDASTLPPETRERIVLAQVGGTTMRVRSVRDLDLWAPAATFGEDGWRVEVASASAQLTDPDTRIDALAGWAESAEANGIRFALETFRAGSSSLTAAGEVRLGGETPVFDVQLRADPLAFADVQWFVPAAPSAGQAIGNFSLASRANGQTAITGQDVVVTAFDSRITGRFSALVGGEQPVTFADTRLVLDPFRLETLAQLGLVDSLAYTGEVRGTLVSAAGSLDEAVPLSVDLTATFRPTVGDIPISTVFLRGPLTVMGENAPVRFEGVEVTAQPLYLAALRPLAPEQAERLQGIVRGSARLTGTPSDLRVDQGNLAYQVGNAAPTRLTGLTLDLVTEPELRFTLDARAEPVALATISALFPAFPFRTAAFAGPIHLEGTANQIRIDTELSGAAGLIALQGTIAPGETLGFDLSGRVAAFNAQAVLARSSPIEGPVTGTFAAAGNVDDFRFNVDLTQATSDTAALAGRFTLGGTFRRVGGEPLVEVAGDVVDFNLGALMGRPSLFPSRMAGSVRIGGGGAQPYRFNLDLRGEGGALDVEGWYDSGPVPSYQLAGAVQGLNLRYLPSGESLPESSLNATIDITGQGTTLETLAGDFRIDATPSTIAGRPLDDLRVDVAIRDGVANFDTLVVALADTRLNAEGTWGLTGPVSTPLNFELVARDLSSLAPFLPQIQGVEPQMSGSFTLEGSVAGSVRVPVVDVAFNGEDLRYEAWRARDLEFGLAATLSREIDSIRGELSLTGSGLDLGGNVTLATLQLGLEGGGPSIAVRAAANRDSRTGAALTGVLQMRGTSPSGILLDSLVVRAPEDVEWALTTPADLRWGGVDGILINGLNLERVGAPGMLSINGTLPPSGSASLRVVADNVDVAMIRQFVPTLPVVGGVIQMTAELNGPVTDPSLNLSVLVRDLLYRDVAADSVSIAGQYAQRRFVGNVGLWEGATRLAVAEASIPMLLAFENSLPTFEMLREDPLAARISADSLPIGLLVSSLPDILDPTGHVSTEVTAAGSIADPELRGWAEVHDGAATFAELGIRYQGMNGRASFDGQLVTIDSLVVESDGTATLDGTIRLVDLETPELFLDVTMDGFHAIQNEEVADLTLGGVAQLRGRMPRPVLTGDVEVQQGTIYFPHFGEQVPLELTELEISEVIPDSLLAEAVAPGFVQNVQIDNLNVTIDEGVWMEAPTARVEIAGELVIVRTGREMRLYGNLAAVRGTYTLRIGPITRNFEVVGGSVRFLGTADLNPELDITAEHDVRTGNGSPLAIAVRVTGTAQFPRIALTSNTRPPLPESELLNYLVFGQPTFRLSQQQGLASDVVQQVLSGFLLEGFSEIGLCQYLRLGGGPEVALGRAALGSTSLECGVQLARDVFLTFETGLASAFNANPLSAFGVSIDWQIKDYLAARIAREPITVGGTRFFQSGDIPYQWSAGVDGTWEFSFPDTTAPANPTPGTVAPGQVGPTPAPAAPGPITPPLVPPTPAPAPAPATPGRREAEGSN